MYKMAHSTTPAATILAPVPGHTWHENAQIAEDLLNLAVGRPQKGAVSEISRRFIIDVAETIIEELRLTQPS